MAEGAFSHAYLALEAPANGWKLVIVDNGSTDQTRDIANLFRDRLRLTRLCEPQDGKNAGLEHRVGARIRRLDLCSLTTTRSRGPIGSFYLRRLADWRIRTLRVPGGRIVPRWETDSPAWVLSNRFLGLAFAISDPQLTEAHQFNWISAPIWPFALMSSRPVTVLIPVLDRRSKSYPMGSETERCAGR